MSDVPSKKRSKKDKKHDSGCAEAVEGKIKDKVLVEEKRLSQMSVKELGELLATQGLSKTGKKAELVARLITGVPDGKRKTQFGKTLFYIILFFEY